MHPGSILSFSIKLESTSIRGIIMIKSTISFKPNYKIYK